MRERFAFTLFLAFSQFLLQAVPSAVVDADIQDYIERHVELAKKFAYPKGIPIAICIAQALHESNAGRSTLAIEANNHFGIKAHNRKAWSGEKFYIEDDDFDKHGNLKKSAFRKYASVVESFKDYVEYLTTNTRYKTLFEIPKTNYRAWAEAIGKSGYATDSTYAQRLVQKIEQYELYRYDDWHIPETSKPLNGSDFDTQVFGDDLVGRKINSKMAGVAVPKTKESFASNFNKKQGEVVQVKNTVVAPQQPTLDQVSKKRLAPVPPPPCPTPPQNLDPMRAKPIFQPIRLKTE